MQSFIEKQSASRLRVTAPRSGGGRVYPPKKDKTIEWECADISSQDLAKLANIHESNLKNNNIFAGKNLSDNTKITSYYTLKAMPPY